MLFHSHNATKENRNSLRRTGYILCAVSFVLIAAIVCLAVSGQDLSFALSSSSGGEEEISPEEEKKENYIHWVDFNVPYEVLDQALQYDLKSHKIDDAVKLNWIELLAYTAAKSGGTFKQDKQSAAMDSLVKRLRAGEKLADITQNMRYYIYYMEAYTAVLGGFVGEYETVEEGGGIKTCYGLKVYSPIAKGYGYGHYDDFGTPRTYGYKRLHLGNDLMGSIGTPIIAVEGGVVQALGWNQYGGWRVGIRSHDGLRYYYYAHLRKDHPYVKDLKQGDEVHAGDVIGYLGMTGYSRKENVNNIKKPHLHFGMQLIFDESQVDGVNQIWVDVYHIVQLLKRSRIAVEKSALTGEYMRADSLAQGE